MQRLKEPRLQAVGALKKLTRAASCTSLALNAEIKSRGEINVITRVHVHAYLLYVTVYYATA